MSVHPLCVAKTYNLTKHILLATIYSAKAEREKHPPMKAYLQKSEVEPNVRATIKFIDDILKSNCVPSENSRILLESAKSHLQKALQTEDSTKMMAEINAAEQAIRDAMSQLEYYVEWGKEAPYV